MESEIQLIERTDSTLKALEDAEIKRLNSALDASYKSLEQELLRKYPNYTAEAKPDLLATQRGILLANELQQQLILIDPAREAEITARFEKLLGTASAEGATLGEELIALQQGDSFVKASATVPIEAVAYAAKQSTDRLKSYDAKFAQEAGLIIQQGLIQGWGAMRVSEQLRGRLGVVKGRAETIARTEVISAQNQAAQQTYQSNGVDYVQIVATADDRICVFCSARNGNVYRLGEAQVPVHPRCRCFASPWSPEWAALGLTSDKRTADFREQGIKALKAKGLEPNDGLTPFERAAGLTKPPEIVWKPGDKPLTLHESLIESGRVAAEALDAGGVDMARSVRVELEALRGRIRSGEISRDDAENLLPQIQSDGAAAMQGLLSELMSSNPDDVVAAERAAGKVRIDESAAARRSRIQLTRILKDFALLTDGKGFAAPLDLIYREPRAWANNTAINIGKQKTVGETRRILFHEMGHRVELESPALNKAAQDWIQSRATGAPKPLNSILRTTVYNNSELAYPDKFITPYVGKFYKNGYTEVFAVGLEYFSSAAKLFELFARDEDHFYMMMGALKMGRQT